ncbi:MAG: hypothetical protein M0Q94_06515 [Candidatus Cloacimonetes bacterium]|nr:hypothetical protein [Candidatus Cloacimonadota bacterium]
MESKINKYKIWFLITLIIGLIGFFDIASKNFANGNEFISNFGMVSYVFMTIFSSLVGIKIGATLAIAINTILQASIVWIIAAILLKIRLNKLIKIKKTDTK